MIGNNSKTILITGINGFLGSHLAKQLSNNYDILGLEYHAKNLNRIKDLNFNVYESRNDDLEKIFLKKNIFAVIHAATVYRRGNEPFDKLISSNILLPVKLLELSNKFETTLFINTDSFFNQPYAKYTYLADYTLSKRHVLEWLKTINGKCKLINMKLFHVFGPSDSSNKFIPQMINSLKRNIPKIELTEGEQKRDFIFVDDVVNAYQSILHKYKEFNKNYYHFEVGTGKSVSIKEFISLIKKITKSKTKLIFGALPYRQNEIMNSKAANSDLLKLGWEPKFNLKKGLKKIISS